MKTVNNELSSYLNSEKNMISCDLFVLQLADGTKCYYTNADKSITYDDDFTHFVIKDNNSSRKIDVFFNWINQPISVKANGNDLFTDLPLDEKEITIAPFSAKAVLSE